MDDWTVIKALDLTPKERLDKKLLEMVAEAEMTKPTNPKDRSAISKLDLSLFPTTAIAYGALAMVEGDAKYGGHNWRVAGVLASVYVAACKRHLDKWFEGQAEDPKTTVPHLGNAIACLGILIDSIESGVLKDDRPPATVDLDKLLDKFQEKVKHLQQLFPNGPDRYTEEGERQKFIKKEDH